MHDEPFFFLWHYIFTLYSDEREHSLGKSAFLWPSKMRGKAKHILCGNKHPLSPLHLNLSLVTAERHSYVINVSQ